MSPCLLKSLVVIALLGIAAPAAAQDRLRVAVAPTAGELGGTVRDETGTSLAGAGVLAIGATVAATITDPLGRFTLSLPAGSYLLRVARSGYLPATARLVQILPARRVERQITLARDAEAAADQAAAGTSDIAWRLRHLSRTVLRDVAHGAESLEGDAAPGLWQTPSPARLASARRLDAVSAFFTETPFTGHVSLFTSTVLGGARATELPGAARGLANLAIGAPLGARGDWQVRGLMSSGSTASWGVLGEYHARPAQPQQMHILAAYSSQAVTPVGSAYSGPIAPVPGETNTAAAVRVSNGWRLTSRVAVDHSVRVDRDDALTAPMLVSPAASVRVAMGWRSSAVLAVDQAVSGPRTDALLPSATGGPWMPLMHTLSSTGRTGEGVRPETVRTVRATLAHDIAPKVAAVVSAEWFRQSIDDQMAMMFGARGSAYRVLSVGDARVDGWRVRVSAAPVAALRGTVEYAAARAQWIAGNAGLSGRAASLVHAGANAVEDLQSSLTWRVPRTSTVAAFTHRLTRVRAASEAAWTRQRFACWIEQRAPFQPLTSGDVTMFLDLRTSYFDDESASVYDELLAARHPARVTGGLHVQF